MQSSAARPRLSQHPKHVAGAASRGVGAQRPTRADAANWKVADIDISWSKLHKKHQEAVSRCVTGRPCCDALPGSWYRKTRTTGTKAMRCFAAALDSRLQRCSRAMARVVMTWLGCCLLHASCLLLKARAFKATLKAASFSACTSGQETEAEQHGSDRDRGSDTLRHSHTIASKMSRPLLDCKKGCVCSKAPAGAVLSPLSPLIPDEAHCCLTSSPATWPTVNFLLIRTMLFVVRSSTGEACKPSHVSWQPEWGT